MQKMPAQRCATMLHRLFLSLLLLFSLLLAACSDDEQQGRPINAPAPEPARPADTVARVGDEFITYGYLNAMLNNSAMMGTAIPGLGTPERTRALLELLDKAISANLFYLDAKKKGIDRLAAYKEDVNRFESTLLASMYKNMLMRGEVQVSETEVLHYFNTQRGKDSELTDEARSMIEVELREKKLELFEAALRDRIREDVDVVIREDILNAEYDTLRSEADVVASYDTHRVTWSQVKDLMLDAGSNPSGTDGYVLNNAERRTRLEQHIDNAIMALKGRAAGLENDPVFAKQVAEYRKARLINEHRNGLMHSWNPDEGTLRAYFDSNRAMFTVPEARRVQVVTVDSRDEAENVLALIRSGETTMEQAAREHAKDPQLMHTGGHIGWISRGSGLVDFEDLIFRLEPGVISEPVEAGAGWYLLKVVAVENARLENFENPHTRQRVFRAYMQDRFNTYVVDLREHHFKVAVYGDVLNAKFEQEADFMAEMSRRAGQEDAGQPVDTVTPPMQQ